MSKSAGNFFTVREIGEKIPGGMDCIQAGDTVVIVTTHTGFQNIEDILR